MEDQSYLLQSYQESWHDTNYRWVALALACLLQMGNYFCVDFPAVLKDQILEQFDVDSLKYNLLYTVYSFPNIILPLIGGVLIDKIGLRKGIMFFPIFLMIGQGLCVFGSIQNNYNYLIIGRIIFGLSGENMTVVQSAVVCKWFDGKEMALALGLNITLSRLASIINGIVTPKIYDINQNITLSLIFGFFFLIFSWLCGVALCYMDSKSDKRDQSQQQGLIDEEIKCSDIKEFKIDLWLVVVSCLICYTNLLVFQQNNVPMFKKMYLLSDDSALFAYSIPYYMGSIFTPFMGFLIDKIGQRTSFLILASCIILLVDIWYMIMPSCSTNTCYLTPFLGQAVLGIFYTFYSAVLWPTVPLCVPAHTVGTAFGVTNAIQNGGSLALGPIIVGQITNEETIKSYRMMMIFFTGLGILGLINNIVLKAYDKYYLNNMLSKNSKSLRKSVIQPNLHPSDTVSMQQQEQKNSKVQDIQSQQNV